MLLPIGDEDRERSRPAYITIGLVFANILVYFLFQGGGANTEFIYGWSVVPQEIVTGEDLVRPAVVEVEGKEVEVPQAPGPAPIYLTILSAMFMHGGFAHLFGNLLYLWIFGDNVEHRFGGGQFLGFYLVSGIAATFAQIALDPSSVIPNLGASGAISGVLGAYLVLFPRNRVFAVFLFNIVAIPAALAIGLWVVFQFVNGLGAVMVTQETVGGVAYGAHIGGFLAGVVLALFLRVVIKERERPNIFSRAEERSSRRYW